MSTGNVEVSDVDGCLRTEIQKGVPLTSNLAWGTPFWYDKNRFVILMHYKRSCLYALCFAELKKLQAISIVDLDKSSVDF